MYFMFKCPRYSCYVTKLMMRNVPYMYGGLVRWKVQAGSARGRSRPCAKEGRVSSNLVLICCPMAAALASLTQTSPQLTQSSENRDSYTDLCIINSTIHSHAGHLNRLRGCCCSESSECTLLLHNGYLPTFLKKKKHNLHFFCNF